MCTGGIIRRSAAAVSARQCVVSLEVIPVEVLAVGAVLWCCRAKATYGCVSRYGLVAYASSLDVIGYFGSSVADAGLLLQSICGHDKLDATSCKREVNDFTSQFISKDYFESQPLKGLRVGVISEALGGGVDPEVVSSIRGTVKEVLILR
ncbi:putative glutaminyl-tRNA synthase (glutamine-hydrolyzing) [Helianthus annuus]|nr:putative glutaminyl-tRNA synthase (glutamine-hydrolyzing) [Helianthus annuus]